MQTSILLNKIRNALRTRDLVGAKNLLEKFNKLANSQNSKDYWSCKYMLAELQSDHGALVTALRKLYELMPNELQVLDLMANYFVNNKQFSDAAECYEQDFLRNPQRATSAYNCAYYNKIEGNYLKSIRFYKSALSLNIASSEEVLLNMSVIFSEGLQDEQSAKECLNQALKISPSYIPAMLNLANLHEQEGDRIRAILWLKNVLEIETEHPQALARLADLEKFTTGHEPLLTKMRRIVVKSKLSLQEKLDLHFALGKSLDQCGSYQEAFEHYHLANNLNKKLVPTYSKPSFQDFIDSSINLFSKEFIERYSSTSDYQPIFICGMFRSGTTLVEQVLSSHSQIVAGGELDFFVRLVAKQFTPFPASLENIDIDLLNKSSIEYQRFIEARYHNAKFVTDKRPDNFQYIGLIKIMFPRAKILYTHRTMLDNCLSVYFQQLGSGFSYATDLNNIAHYYQQQDRLMQHWKKLFPKDLNIINYDRLVESPQAEIQAILGFLNLPWEDNCLMHHKNKNFVKTASVWQVREPIHNRSSGRSKNYADQLAKFISN